MDAILAATNLEDLRSKLGVIDISVASHPKERTNQQVETYSLVSLLGSISWQDSCFPIQVFRRERPDFLVVCNSREIGLEHTEAINQNLAKERALRADGHGPEMYFPTQASVNDPPRSKADILAQIEANEEGDGYIGDSVERNWAEAISHFIERKVVSAKKTGYDLYGDDRLMIYDNWPTFALRYRWALPHLRDQLKGSPVWSIFKTVYIIDDRVVLELTREQEVFHDARRWLAI